MATSGNPALTSNRNDIIDGALRLMRVTRRRASEQAGAGMLADGMRRLNAMVKAWQAEPGLKVWANAEATLFPQAEQVTYAVGDSATDHCTTTYTATAISADEASGQTVLSVESITGISSGDHLGVQLDDGTIHWTTVNGAPTAGTVTATLAIADSAAAGNTVWAYTSNISKPLKIVQARLYDIETGNETEIDVEARLEYNLHTNKTETGSINSLFYDPGRVSGSIKIWQPPALVTELVNFTWHRPLDSFVTAADEPDFPAEWTMALEYGLASAMAAEYDIPADHAQRIDALAAQYLDSVAGFDREAESISFAPDMGDYR